ncbi:hypothetical protein TSAR_004960, partial [Trichomalopsis sarcophagae]
KVRRGSNDGRYTIISDYSISTKYRRARKVCGFAQNDVEILEIASSLAKKFTVDDTDLSNGTQNENNQQCKSNISKHTADSAAAFYLEQKLNKNSYISLSKDCKMRNAPIYPRYSAISKALSECLPNGYDISEVQIVISFVFLMKLHKLFLMANWEIEQPVDVQLNFTAVAESLKYGLGLLHAEINTFDNLLNISYRMLLKTAISNSKKRNMTEHSRQTSRLARITDVFNRAVHMSDPKLSLMHFLNEEEWEEEKENTSDDDSNMTYDNSDKESIM